jgi:hypothetical protein
MPWETYLVGELRASLRSLPVKRILVTNSEYQSEPIGFANENNGLNISDLKRLDVKKQTAMRYHRTMLIKMMHSSHNDKSIEYTSIIVLLLLSLHSSCLIFTPQITSNVLHHLITVIAT